MRTFSLLLLAALLGLPARAQTALQLGTPASGVLDAADPKTDDGQAYDVYTYRSAAAQTVTVMLHADSFDTFLYAGTGTGSAWHETERDDDGGEGLDSRLVLHLDAGQTIVLRASSVGDDGGSYTISVLDGEVGGDDGESTTAPPSEVDPARIQPVRLGAAASGRIEGGSDALFRVMLPTGTYTIVVDTADFDATIEVGTLGGTTFTPTVNDDDSGRSTNPLVVYTAEQSGPVIVRVRGFADNAGAFGVRILEGDQSAEYADADGDYSEELPGPVEVDPAAAQTLRVGQASTSRIDAGAGALLRFTPTTSGAYTVVVDTADFDPMLETGTLEGTTFTPTARDDDSGHGLFPLLVAEGTAGQALYFRVVGFQDAAGTFGVRVLDGDQSAAFADPDEPYDEGSYGTVLDVSQAVPVRVGTTRRTVGADSPALDWDEQRRFDLLRFDVARAGTYTIAVTSEAFDPGFEIGTMQDSLYVTDSSDEDAGAGIGAALVLDLTEGPHYLRVLSDTLRRGAYTLTLLEGDHGSEYVEAQMPDHVDVRRAATVRAGASINGSLDRSDALDLPWDGPTDVYLFDATAGQTVTVDVESSGDADPYVEIGSLAGDVFTQLATDDDSGEGLNAILTFTFERAGRYVIRVSSINRQTGAYTLRLR